MLRLRCCFVVLDVSVVFWCGAVVLIEGLVVCSILPGTGIGISVGVVLIVIVLVVS